MVCALTTYQDVLDFFAEKHKMTRQLSRQILTVCKSTQCVKFIKSLYILMHRLFSLPFCSFNTQLKKLPNFVLAPSITILLLVYKQLT